MPGGHHWTLDYVKSAVDRVFDKEWDHTFRKDSVEEIDLSKDTDNDGISDYYEKEMRAGNLVLGNGVPVGAVGPKNPDSEGDSLKAGTEVQIVTSNCPGR
ncbi:hypothetical protein NKH18_02640 [Streptomyces sp. M10(2022)]